MKISSPCTSAYEVCPMEDEKVPNLPSDSHGLSRRRKLKNQQVRVSRVSLFSVRSDQAVPSSRKTWTGCMRGQLRIFTAPESTQSNKKIWRNVNSTLIPSYGMHILLLWPLSCSTSCTDAGQGGAPLVSHRDYRISPVKPLLVG